MAVEYGEGFGREYKRPVSSTTTTGRRKEVMVRTTVGGKEITVYMRDSVVPHDPYLNLVRAALYQKVVGGLYPAPRVPRALKDFLIKTNITI